MCAVVAAFEGQQGAVDLHGSSSLRRVIALMLPDGGNYAVFGKVVVANTNDDFQYALVQLGKGFGAVPEEGFFPVLDQSSARIGPKGKADHVTISVQSRKVELGESGAGGFVAISCATYRGKATEARLTAMRLADFT